MASLPDNWANATLADACCVERGVTFPASAKSDTPSETLIPCLRTANVQEEVTWDDLIYIPHEYVKSRAKHLRPGDILISMANSRELVGKVSYVHDVPTESTLGGFIAALRSTAIVDSKYLFYFLRARGTQESLRSRASQTVNIANLSLGGIYETRIAIAPKNEQRRIVDAIEQQFTRLDAGVAALKRAQAALKRYRAAVLKAAVEGKLTEEWRAAHRDAEPAPTLLARILAERRARWEADLRAKGKDPAKAKYAEPKGPDTAGLPALPEGWCWATVEQLLSASPCNGISVKGTDAPPGTPALKLSAMSEFGFDYSDRRYITIPPSVTDALAIKEGDFFVARGNGSLHLVGRGTLAQLPTESIVFPDTMIRLRFVREGQLTDYVSCIWASSLVREQIERTARTTAGIYKISQQDIRAFVLPLPPLNEQCQIINDLGQQLSTIKALEAVLAANLTRAERLRQSILERAFSGRLVAQDPRDEPASVLLERVQGLSPRPPLKGREPGSRRGRGAARGKSEKGTRRPPSSSSPHTSSPRGPSPLGEGVGGEVRQRERSTIPATAALQGPLWE